MVFDSILSLIDSVLIQFWFYFNSDPLELDGKVLQYTANVGETPNKSPHMF